VAKNKSHLLLIFTAVILLSLLYFYLDPSQPGLFPPCPFYSITGLYCPGCGSQRAFHALMHGDILRSAGYNILFVVFLPLIAISALITTANIFLKRNRRYPLFQSAVFSRAVLIVVLLFWVLRNLPYYPVSLLAP
jgi:hypothetical protein